MILKLTLKLFRISDEVVSGSHQLHPSNSTKKPGKSLSFTGRAAPWEHHHLWQVVLWWQSLGNPNWDRRVSLLMLQKSGGHQLIGMFSPLFTRFYTSQVVVLDYFHQQQECVVFFSGAKFVQQDPSPQFVQQDPSPQFVQQDPSPQVLWFSQGILKKIILPETNIAHENPLVSL